MFKAVDRRVVSLGLAGLFVNGWSRADWPLFRGDPAQKGTADKSLGSALKIRWKVEGMESIDSTAAIVGGMVAVGGGNGWLQCFELASGKSVWKYKAAADKPSGKKNAEDRVIPFKAPVTWDGQTVFIGDVEGNFHAVDGENGKKLWIFTAGGEISGGANISGKHVLFGGQDDTLRCLDRNGKEVWNFKTDGPFYGSVAVAGGKTFAAGCDSTLHVIDIATGKEESKIDLGGQTGATVAVDGDQLFIGTMNREFLRVDWRLREIAWKFTAENRPQEFFSSAAISGNWVVVGSRDSRIHAFDRKTGHSHWSFLTKGKVDASPIIVAKSLVYAASLDGFLYSLDLETGKNLGSIELDEGISASPAISDGKLIIGTQKGTLYCLEST